MHIFALPDATIEELNCLLSCQCSSPEELMSVLWRTEAIFTKQNILTIFAYLLNHDLVVELMLSGSSGSLPFDKWLMDKFPTTLTEYSSSVFPRIISRISNLLNSASFSPLAGEWSIDQLQNYHRLQEATTPVFQLLSELKFDSTKRGKPVVKNPRRDRRNSAATQNPTSEILEHFSLTVPRTAEERDGALATIIGQMKHALKFYLKALGAPHSQQTIIALFLSTQAAIKSKEPGSNGQLMQATRPDTTSFTLADRLEGFGEWKVFVSKRAERNLRDAHRKNPTIFNIVMKKIRELSQGYFTDDNQKRLSGPDAGIPIFEAKMSRDTRLVYQIHCAYNYDTKVEEQVIRIFGVYTHAKLDKRLWNSIGRQLGSKGPEYRQKCLYRQAKDTGFGDSVFVPASFTSSEHTTAPQISSGPGLPSGDLEGVHSILVLENYMIMSEGLLQSILADLNITFPFHLSPQEQEIVEYKGSSYVVGRSGTGKSTSMLHKIIWREMLHRMHPDTIARPRQLFVTQSVNLVQKVSEDYDKLLVSFQLSHATTDHLQLNQLVGLMSEAPKLRKPLPSKFSELEEDHFPLFITYDKLLQLIEGDHGISFEKKWGMDGRPLLSFSKFQRQYWPRLSRATGIGGWMDPNLVFNEIIGVIEGSEQTLSSNNCFLDRTSYCKLSIRTNPTFAGHRNELYTLFETYQRCKQEFGDHDPAERTHTLLQKLYNDNMQGKKIDYLYVDEAQDNLLIDALVLRLFCHNANGLFWAGDTAQTILAGSSFRFEDLKSFLYRIEQKHLDTISPSQTYLSAGGSVPAMFQLTTNFRSHKGITNCAHAVIELLNTFWPETIDALAPEQGVVDGVKPVFLVEWGANRNAHILSKSSTGAKMELGSNQCILVRNEAAREALCSELHNATIVTTIYDSKGLEFDDVLILNFFEDSLCDVSQWRLVLNNLRGDPCCNHRIPVFDPLYHAGLCTELKFLYVAITRARKTVWIADRSEKAEPMKNYWLSRDQITLSRSNSGLEKLVAFSSPEDWAARGEDFFRRGDFVVAKQCFERASLPHKASETYALHLREIAREIPTNPKEKSQQAFVAAANAFVICANQRTDGSEKSLFVEAAQCFALANDWNTATDTFLKVQDFDSAAECYFEPKEFGNLYKFYKCHESKISKPMITKIRVAACNYYYQQDEFHWHKASRFFSSEQEETSLLRNQKWMQPLAKVYERTGKYEKAARIYIAEKRVLQAIPLLLKCQPTCTREVSRFILNELWKYISFSKRPVNHPSISSLLNMWEDVNKEKIGNDAQEEFQLLRTVLKCEICTIGKKARDYLSKKNVPAALLCFSLYFIDFPPKANQAGDVAEVLHLFHDYTVALTSFTLPWTDGVHVNGHPLYFYPFGIRSASSNSLLCLNDTFLYSTQTPAAAQLVGRRTQEGIEIPRSSLKARFRQHLESYLDIQFRRECDFFASYLDRHSPCISRSTFGICHQQGTNRRYWGQCNEDQQNHGQRSKDPQHQCHNFTAHEWRTRVYVILGHSMIVQHLSSYLAIGMNHRKSVCMNLLYQALAGLSSSSGETKPLDLLPLIEDGKRLIRYWSGHPEFALDYDNPDILLPWLLRGMKTQILRSDQRPAVNHLQWVRLSLGPKNLRGSVIPSLHGFSWEHLVTDLERLQPDHRVNRIETALIALRLLLDTPYQIELDILCTWLEYLTGLILVKPLWAAKLEPSTQITVTLPLATAIQCINRAPDKTDTERPLQISSLFHLGERLLRLLFFESTKERFVPTDVSVARICRTLCIIGYNHPEFIPMLLETLGTLKSACHRGHSRSLMYFSASTSQELLPLIIRTEFSPDQRLVQLHEHEIGVQDVDQIPGITTLSYLRNEADELFDRLVGLVPVQTESHSALNAVKVFVKGVLFKSPATNNSSAPYPTPQEAQKMDIRENRISS